MRKDSKTYDAHQRWQEQCERCNSRFWSETSGMSYCSAAPECSRLVPARRPEWCRYAEIVEPVRCAGCGRSLEGQVAREEGHVCVDCSH